MSKKNFKINDFINIQAMSGILLGIATLIALFARNSFWSDLYTQSLSVPLFSLYWMGLPCSFNMVDILNEGLMVCFFILVSIEIKKEFLVGVFRDAKHALLPCAAALGGVVMPALIYLFFNNYDPILRNGWAIPTATDIAFSLGVLSLLGQRVPVSLRIFLTTLAVVDDLCAVLMIALFYSGSLQWVWLGFSLVLTGFLYTLNRLNVQSFYPYLLVGLPFWWGILQSGIHATIAGVVWAAFIPTDSFTHHEKPALLDRIEHYLRPVVNCIVVPIFAFVNAGVPLNGINWPSVSHPLFLGVFLGLAVGKPLGILLGMSLVLFTGVVPLPSGLHLRHLFSMACLGGIGFTMSLLIGGVAFSEGRLLVLTRQAILISSLFSAVIALLIFPKTRTGFFADHG